MDEEILPVITPEKLKERHVIIKRNTLKHALRLIGIGSFGMGVSIGYLAKMYLSSSKINKSVQ